MKDIDFSIVGTKLSLRAAHAHHSSPPPAQELQISSVGVGSSREAYRVCARFSVFIRHRPFCVLI